jgi:hypothetical protein
MLLPFSTAQWFSLAGLALSIAMFYMYFRTTEVSHPRIITVIMFPFSFYLSTQVPFAVSSILTIWLNVSESLSWIGMVASVMVVALLDLIGILTKDLDAKFHFVLISIISLTIAALWKGYSDLLLGAYVLFTSNLVILLVFSGVYRFGRKSLRVNP